MKVKTAFLMCFGLVLVGGFALRSIAMNERIIRASLDMERMIFPSLNKVSVCNGDDVMQVPTHLLLPHRLLMADGLGG